MIVFDLDGTLFHHDPEDVPDYENPESLAAKTWPDEDAIWLARVMHERGEPIAFVTGRPEHARAATERQLLAAGLPNTPLLMREGPWTTWASYTLQKLAHLTKLRPDAHIGDLEADRDATPPGTLFIHATKWRELSQSLRATANTESDPYNAAPASMPRGTSTGEPGCAHENASGATTHTRPDSSPAPEATLTPPDPNGGEA